MSDTAQVTNQDAGDFSAFIANTRAHLTEQSRAIIAQCGDLHRELDAIDREMAAIDAYEAAKTGKTLKTNATTATRTRRVRRGSRREELMNLIGQNNGLSRGEILERMGLRGDKSGEMSVSNALTALGKGNHVRREGGKYHPVAAGPAPSFEDVHGALREAAE